MPFGILPLDGDNEKCARGVMGGPLFVGCSCGLASEGTEGDCFGGNAGFGLLTEPERGECAGGPVVLGPWGGTGLTFRGLNGTLR